MTPETDKERIELMRKQLNRQVNVKFVVTAIVVIGVVAIGYYVFF